MKKTFFLLIFSLVVLGAAAQDYRIVPLWDSRHPMPGDNRITEPESTTAPHGYIWNITRPEVWVYLPSDSAVRANGGGRVPAVAICPGGGYEIVSARYEGHDYARFLSANGIAGVIVKYRQPNGVAAVPGDDVRRALQIVRDSASRWHIDPHRIGVSGFSAGGHLAATVAAHPGRGSKAPAFQILYYPVVTFADTTICHMGSRRNLTRGDVRLDDYYSPERNVTRRTPPALLFVSEDDDAVHPKNSYLLCDSLRAHGVSARVVSFPYGGHGWGYKESFSELPTVKKEVLDFIRRR